MGAESDNPGVMNTLKILYSQPIRGITHTSIEWVMPTCSSFLVSSNTQLSLNLDTLSFSVGQAPPDFLVSQSQTVLPGNSVNLYCLPKSDSSLNDSITWSFRNLTIDQVSHHSSHYDVVDGGRVLVIRNVSVATSGEYTCRTGSGEEHSAFVEALGEFLGHNSMDFLVIYVLCVLHQNFQFCSSLSYPQCVHDSMNYR